MYCAEVAAGLSLTAASLLTVFLADADLDLACDGPERGSGADGDGADSDTDSLPPAVPEKTQAAYQVPTPVRDVLQQEQQQSLPLPLPPPLPPQQQQQPESLGESADTTAQEVHEALMHLTTKHPCKMLRANLLLLVHGVALL